MEKLVIAGSGCAGLTAGVYAARAELKPLIISGTELGGQLTGTTSVENFPGFPEGVGGPDLIQLFMKQAERFGARRIEGEIASSRLTGGGPHELSLVGGDTIETEALIIATGAGTRWLALPSETALRNKGVSSCATCDGALFRSVPVTVVGGGDTALEDAIFLTRFASKVTIIHRRDQLRGSKIMAQRAADNEKIEFRWDSVVDEILDPGQDRVTGVVVRNVKTDEKSTIECEAVFVAIGHIPNTKAFAGQIDLDEQGYILLSDGARSMTNIEGVFAAGDCADHTYRQAITAAGMGCRAAIDAERWLEPTS